MSLLNELKRRNVFKVGAAYLALAWVVVQATGAIVPALNLPATLVPTVVWIGIIGFPCVLIFSWAYELTPEGLKRESEVDRSQSITHVTGKRLDYIIIGLMVVAIGLFVTDRFLPRASAPAAPVASAAVEAPVTAETPSAGATATAPPASAPAPVQAAAPAPSEKSIAVLPFVNMSEDTANEYFSDGISEELLNLLAQARDLKVIARTSSFAFKDTNTPIAEIAKQLNVAHVLEGSVRKAGNQVRITAQLIRTADSTHLWSDTYDRPLDDIFAVQSEIAKAIGDALQIKLIGGELDRRRGGTQNVEAYKLYLQTANSPRNTLSEGRQRLNELERAVDLDPTFGLAWWAQASLVGQSARLGRDPKQQYPRARELAQHALRLSPELANAHAELQLIHIIHDWDWEAAQREGENALRIDPSNPYALLHAGILACTLGRWSEAELSIRRAIERDPVNPFLHWNLGFTYYKAGRFAEAETIFRSLMESHPDFRWTRNSLARTLLARGQPEAALAMAQSDFESERLWNYPVFLHAVGRIAEADAAQQEQLATNGSVGPTGIAMTYAYRGDHDRAIEWLDRAYAQKDPDVHAILGEPLWRSIARDPRFIAFLKKMNLPTEPVPVNWQ